VAYDAAGSAERKNRLDADKDGDGVMLFDDAATLDRLDADKDGDGVMLFDDAATLDSGLCAPMRTNGMAMENPASA